MLRRYYIGFSGTLAVCDRSELRHDCVAVASEGTIFPQPFHSHRHTCLLLLSFSRQSNHKLHAHLIWRFCIRHLLHLLFASVMACHEIVEESGLLGCGRLSSANWLVVTMKCHTESNSKSKATLILWWTFHWLYFHSVMVPANISKLFPLEISTFTVVMVGNLGLHACCHH